MGCTPACSSSTGGESSHLDARQFQKDALRPLFIVTCLVGLALIMLGATFRRALGPHWVGYPMFLLLYPAYLLLRGKYLLRAWLLVLAWLTASAATALLAPIPAAIMLMMVPVVLAALLIGAGAAIIVGSLTCVLFCSLVWLDPEAYSASDGVLFAAALCTITAMVVLALRPLQDALRWSWQHYEEARLGVEQLRDAQADLKQAIRDLEQANAERVRLNQLLATARRVAEDAERSKADFVASVSHELRTPLNMIIGFTEMMMRSPAAYGKNVPPALLADLGVVYRNSQHLSSLIDDVLDLSQIEAGRMALTRERVALAEIVQAAVEAVRPLFECKALCLEAQVPAELPAVYCDRTRIREVLLNLLSNAGRATERGGVTVRAWQEGPEIVVSVTDTGPGISPADQERLFRPFEQLAGTAQHRWGGTGLGLTISKRFVELHGGRIWLESRVGKGTTFYFGLPIDPPAGTEGGPLRWFSQEWSYRQRTRRSPVPAVHPRPRLLVVESDDAVGHLLRRYLDGVEIVSTSDIQDALRQADQMSVGAVIWNAPSVASVLLALSDLSLPQGIPVMACAVPGPGQAAKELGVREYLTKPVRRDDLLAALGRIGLTGGTILVVEDEPEAQRLFWRMLASAEGHFRVLTAGDGREALEVLEHERPDAILLDLVMPGMDGYHVLDALSQDEKLRAIPVIIISALDPVGHRAVSSAFAVTNKGGLSLQALLAYIDTTRAIAGL